jgi:NAD(P)-dependent dehydrogenase (short-subunit alcohol dehydrogenase family)
VTSPGFWHGKRVLVTGGAGFLGSGLCHALGAQGAEVTALDAMMPGTGAHLANLEGSGATLVTADLRDADLTAVTQDLDAVFNMAAQTSHAGSMQDPFTDLAINAQAQLRLIAGAAAGFSRRHGGACLHPAVLRHPATCRWMRRTRSPRPTPTASPSWRASNTGCWNTRSTAARWSRCG